MIPRASRKSCEGAPPRACMGLIVRDVMCIGVCAANQGKQENQIGYKGRRSFKEPPCGIEGWLLQGFSNSHCNPGILKV